MACAEAWFQAKRMAGAEVLRVGRAWFEEQKEDHMAAVPQRRKRVMRDKVEK